MDNQIIDLTQNGRPLHNWRLYPLLGLIAGHHLPPSGVKETMVGNVKVWVIAEDTNRRQRAPHRVMCACPREGCEWTGSAGRLHQHLDVHEPRPYKKGDRVEVHPSCGYFERGTQFGTIQRTGVRYVRVKFDNTTGRASRVGVRNILRKV